MQRKGKAGIWIFVVIAFLVNIDLLAVQVMAGPARPAVEIAGLFLACCLSLLFAGLFGYVLGLIFGAILWNPQENCRT